MIKSKDNVFSDINDLIKEELKQFGIDNGVPMSSMGILAGHIVYLIKQTQDFSFRCGVAHGLLNRTLSEVRKAEEENDDLADPDDDDYTDEDDDDDPDISDEELDELINSFYVNEEDGDDDEDEDIEF